MVCYERRFLAQSGLKLPYPKRVNRQDSAQVFEETKRGSGPRRKKKKKKRSLS